MKPRASFLRLVHRDNRPSSAIADVQERAAADSLLHLTAPATLTRLYNGYQAIHPAHESEPAAYREYRAASLHGALLHLHEAVAALEATGYEPLALSYRQRATVRYLPSQFRDAMKKVESALADITVQLEQQEAASPASETDSGAMHPGEMAATLRGIEAVLQSEPWRRFVEHIAQQPGYLPSPG